MPGPDGSTSRTATPRPYRAGRFGRGWPRSFEPGGWIHAKKLGRWIVPPPLRDIPLDAVARRVSGQGSTRPGHVVLYLVLVDSLPADNARLVQPRPPPYRVGFYNSQQEAIQSSPNLSWNAHLCRSLLM